MNNENKQTERRKTIVPILATIGAGSVLAAVVSLLGVKWPWLLLIFGIVLIIVAVFLSVPSTVNLLSPKRIFNKFCNTIRWKRYGPKYGFSDLNKPEQIITKIGCDYKVTISLCIINRDNDSLSVYFGGATINLEQKSGRITLLDKLTLATNFLTKAEIKPHQGANYEVPFVGRHNGAGYPNLNIKYNWGIQGINVDLTGVGYKELKKGIYHKTINQTMIGSW